jgi:predicted DNA-binding protein YlxM (UPF0122 family)
MTFSEVMIYFDYKMSNVARFLNVRRQAVYEWHANNEIPFEKQCMLEILTQGELKANKEC